MQYDLLTGLPSSAPSQKTSPDGSAPTMGLPSAPTLPPLWDQIPLSFRQSNAADDGQTRVWLMDPTEKRRGVFSMLNISAWPNDASVCSLSSVLQGGAIPQKYFLSAKACRGILRRAAKRGKQLPEPLMRALKAVADLEPISSAGGGLVTHALRADGFDASEDGTGRGTPLVPVSVPEIAWALQERDSKGADSDTKDGHRQQMAVLGAPDVVGTLSDGAHNGGGLNGQDAYSGRIFPVLEDITPFDTTQITSPQNRSNPQPGDPCHPIAAGAHVPAIIGVVHGTQDPDVNADMAHPLGRNQGQENALVYPILEPGGRTGNATDDPRAGLGIGAENDPAFTLQAAHHHAVAVGVSIRGRDGGSTAEISGEVACANRASQGGGDKPHVMTSMAVRRLTEIECERLQAFPDNFTRIPWRGKPAEECPGGPRYKALGNSWAVNCARWIFQRIDRAKRQAG